MTRMNVTRGLLTAIIACGALAAAASPAQAIKEFSVRIYNRTGRTIQVEVAPAYRSSEEQDVWSLGGIHTQTLTDGQSLASEANGYANTSWSSWVRAYTNPQDAERRYSGCSMVFVNPFFGYPIAFAGLDYTRPNRFNFPSSRFGFAEDESHTFRYRADECRVDVVRHADGSDHKRFDVYFDAVRS